MEEKCKRAGCDGKILDGVCDTCGRAPVGTKLMSAAISASQKLGARGSASYGTIGSGSSSASLSGRTGSGRSGRASGRSGRASSRRQLGAGLISLPELPSLDPLLSVMKDPTVPDRKRFCNNCNAKLNHEKGFCPMCGQEYSFIPTLKPGDVVAGQYEVKGAIAFGGLGWIYLGWDKTLSRWVVLKGLLNSKDEASAAAALAERQFLASVKHPKIVGIYNFVTMGNEGYIVMEYVGGKTLKAIRQERGPLPVAEGIAYIHAILPAFGYLERQGLVYCDFKPDNVMLEEDDVKLIDMGGVRRVDDTDGDVYGTIGYTAPEASSEPNFTSDLYTVARTLLVLLIDFKFQGTYLHTLPTPAEAPLFAQHDALYRFLLRATHTNPDMRFQTADEMAEQLLGVLREVVAVDGISRSYDSPLFTGDTFLERDEEGDAGKIDYKMLPTLKPDAADPAANALFSLGSAAGLARRSAMEKAMQKTPDSSELPLRLAFDYIETGDYAAAEKLLAGVIANDPFDWRVHWYRGISSLAQGRPQDAQAHFDAVYSELPGELAPKLALALSCERQKNYPQAAGYYDRVSRADANFVSAAFGLARCRMAEGDRAGAVAAYQRIPVTSSAYARAQMDMARALLQTAPTAPTGAELAQASAALSALNVEGVARHRLSAELFLTAAAQVEAKAIPASDKDKILGQALQAKALREGAERELRAQARYAQSAPERIALVDRANAERPRTLF